MGGKEIEPAGKGTLGGDTFTSDCIEVQNYFEGILDGKNNTIANLTIKQENMNGVGLIGVLEESGEVKNIKIYNGNIVGKTRVGAVVGENKGIIENCHNIDTRITAKAHSTLNYCGDQVGGIVGFMTNGQVNNCSNNGEIIAKDRTNDSGTGGLFSGGIIGNISAKSEVRITNCTNKGKIQCEVQATGGIIGCCARGTGNIVVQDCVNEGNIIAINGGWSSAGAHSGGIIGRQQGTCTITNCRNIGQIKAEQYGAGGIVGYQQAGSETITNCTNSGPITTGTYGAGGIIGITNKNISSKISNCTNNGAITTGTNCAGGIIGYNKGTGTISNCNNTGEIIANKQQAGGVAGRIDAGEIKDCNNYGYIKSNGENGGARCIAGGIVGTQAGGTIKRVYNEGKVENENAEAQEYDVTGGIVGAVLGGEVKDSYNKGEVTGGDYRGGIVGENQVANSITNSYYHKPEGSTLEGVGVAGENGDTNGATGEANYLFNSLQEFLTYFKIPTTD